MYLPPHFRQTDLPTIHAFVGRHPFGVLACATAAGLCANHLPFVLEVQPGDVAVLWGHVARVNDVWQTAHDQNVLAIFSGAHAYVSPTWYGANETVPTWNYRAVHAHGRFRAIDEDGVKLAVLERSAAEFERDLPSPWTFSRQMPYIERLLPAIVAFRIDVARWEAKWKLGQNQPAERRENAAAQLAAQPGERQRAVAEQMLAMSMASGAARSSQASPGAGGENAAGDG